MSTAGIVAIATRNYLHSARAMCESVHAFHPAAPFWVIVPDGIDRTPANWPEWLVLVQGEQLGISQWRRFAFQYSALELCCALKPFALEWAFQNSDCDRLLYLDCDTLVYAPLQEAIDRLDSANIVLTPHLVRGDAGEKWLSHEEQLLRTGVFNMGFLGVRRTPETSLFLTWWQGRLRKGCIRSVIEHRFYDQIHVESAPAQFHGVTILRDLGYNVAMWNLHERFLERDPASGTIRCGERPLVFFHFSGFDPADPQKLARGRADTAPDTALAALLENYGSRLQACGQEAGEKLGYGLSTMSDGTPIRALWREMIRADAPNLQQSNDPFEACWKPVFMELESTFTWQRADPTASDGYSTLQFEMQRWRENSRRLSRTFPVRQLLWLRQRLLRNRVLPKEEHRER